jgi:hypothetical protein
MLPISNDPGFPSVFALLQNVNTAKMCWLQMQLLPTVDLSVTCTIPAAKIPLLFSSSALPLHPILSLLLHGEEDLLPHFGMHWLWAGFVFFNSVT